MKKHGLKLLTLGLLCCCIVCSVLKKDGFNMENEIAKIKDGLKPLDGFGGREYPDAVTKYFRYYGLEPANDSIEHIFGTFESDSRILAGHIFKPKEYKAVVFALHGYLNHSGQLRHLVRYLTEQNYAVAVFDLPGHGLSDGGRGDIDDFSQYTSALLDFADIVSVKLTGPHHVIGFSTGGSAVLDYLFCGNGNFFDKTVLVAPLVRCAGWEKSKIGFKLYDSFADSIPRLPRKNSSNKDFLEFNRSRDFLHLQKVPVKWVRALHDFNDRISDLQPAEKSLKIIQGSKDGTVDWKFNLEFLRKKFSDTDIVLIENGRHELFNESVDIRETVFSQIKSYLEN